MRNKKIEHTFNKIELYRIIILWQEYLQILFKRIRREKTYELRRHSKEWNKLMRRDSHP